MSFLEMNAVNKSFGAFHAVSNFNLRMEKGEFVSFLGPSGCGKTTTLRMVAGFESPSGGEILMDGQDVTRRPANKRNVGMVFQSYALFPNLNVADNIGFGLKVAGRPRAEIQGRVQEMLSLIHLEHLAQRYPHQLSGGQQQRVALARALAIRPKVLLLDEPLSALDAKIRIELRNEIRAIQRRLEITTIYVTHDQEEALSLSDRVAVMKDGKTEQVGTPSEIYNYPKTPFVASFVGTLNVLEAEVIGGTQPALLVDGQPVRSTNLTAESAHGQSVQLAIRPETVRLSETHPGDNRLTGQVENVLFLGAIVRMRVKLGKNSLSIDVLNSPNLEIPQVDQTAVVYVSPEACLIM